MLREFFSHLAASCTKDTFFGIPPWYQYFELRDVGGVCQVQIELMKNGRLDLSAVFLVAFGILDILLRVGALVAVGFIIYAGVQYVSAQGEPDKAKHALGTIINALIGLGITIVAAAAVSFVGHRLGA